MFLQGDTARAIQNAWSSYESIRTQESLDDLVDALKVAGPGAARVGTRDGGEARLRLNDAGQVAAVIQRRGVQGDPRPAAESIVLAAEAALAEDEDIG